jgi:putative hemolysin
VDVSLTGLVALGVLIVLSAALKMAYVALFNAHKSRLREIAENGHRSAGRVYALANDATRLLASQQLVDLLLHFAIALVAAVTLISPLHDWLVDQGIDNGLADAISYGSILLTVAILTLIFGEMLPAQIATSHADAIALRTVGLTGILSRVLAPILHFLQAISSRLASPFVDRDIEGMVTEEEIKLMVDAGSEGGAIEDEEKEMIFSIFQFGDTLAREVMVPRIDMIALEIQTPLPDALKTIVDAGHSRIPVYEETIDHIRGLLYAKDLLELLRDDDMDRPLEEILRPAHFAPEVKKAGDLLQDLQQRKIHLAIVVDEYGGTAGLVTIEDLIEEIVGEIRDEYDTEEEIYERINEHEYLCDAGIDLDDLNRLMDVRLPTDESDTLGGYVYSKLGKVPVVGERLETGELELEVISVDDRRIRKIRVVRKPSAMDLDEAEAINQPESTAPD